MNFIALDFETANEKRNSACSLGIVKVCDGKIKKKLSYLIKPPQMYFNPFNVSLHGITENHVKNSPTFDVIWPEINAILDGQIVVAHNSSFDISVLRQTLDGYGLDYPKINYYCTCVLSRRVWPQLENHKLNTVADHLKIRFAHHDAKEDAIVCAKIANQCCKVSNVASLPELAEHFKVEPKKLLPKAATSKRKINPSDIVYSSNEKVKTNNLCEDGKMSKCGEIRTTYTKSGLERYELEISHDELNKYKLIKGDDPYVVERKALSEMAKWDEMWSRQLEKQLIILEREKKVLALEEKKFIALAGTEHAQGEMKRLNFILEYTLDVDDTVDWESLKDKAKYPVPQPEKPQLPSKPEASYIAPAPQEADSAYQVKFNILDVVIPSKKQAKLDLAEKKFKYDYIKWQDNRKQTIQRVKDEITVYKETMRKLQEEYTAVGNKWMQDRKKFLIKQARCNSAIEKKKEKYLGGDLSSVEDYCDIVLTNSNYPDYLPKSYELDYNPENKIIIIDYQLPSPSVIPRLSEVKYIQSRDEYQEKNISQAQFNKLYDSVLYQTALRTIHELYEADVIDGLHSIVFNGYVTSTDPATGQEVTGCVFSIQAGKEEFEAVNLANIEPKACFKKLKGVGSSKLHSLTPIAPILQIDKDDKRFVSSYDVTSELDKDHNLAAMDWEDFEHLIREIFEKEFSSVGGEVKVTQASRDGGVDAVVFDPDPIRGGKIAIQAKRYTNTVGVSAVRDLYGTVMNEGANKGILVTTADYGPDAYSFAKGKPLSLLNGGNLLHLLEKHGHSFKIDIKEAKQILADKE